MVQFNNNPSIFFFVLLLVTKLGLSTAQHDTCSYHCTVAASELQRCGLDKSCLCYDQHTDRFAQSAPLCGANSCDAATRNSYYPILIQAMQLCGYYFETRGVDIVSSISTTTTTTTTPIPAGDSTTTIPTPVVPGDSTTTIPSPVVPGDSTTTIPSPVVPGGSTTTTPSPVVPGDSTTTKPGEAGSTVTTTTTPTSSSSSSSIINSGNYSGSISTSGPGSQVPTTILTTLSNGVTTVLTRTPSETGTATASSRSTAVGSGSATGSTTGTGGVSPSNDASLMAIPSFIFGTFIIIAVQFF